MFDMIALTVLCCMYPCGRFPPLERFHSRGLSPSDRCHWDTCSIDTVATNHASSHPFRRLSILHRRLNMLIC